jgi:putative copper export protein
MLRKLILTALLPALPFLASAHAGHSEFSADHILHYLATPVHAMPIAMAVVLGALVVLIVRKELAIKAIRNRED